MAEIGGEGNSAVFSKEMFITAELNSGFKRIFISAVIPSQIPFPFRLISQPISSRFSFNNSQSTGTPSAPMICHPRLSANPSPRGWGMTGSSQFFNTFAHFLSAVILITEPSLSILKNFPSIDISPLQFD